MSRGGFGDAWISFLKIREATSRISTCDMKYWRHCTRWRELEPSITELMSLLPNVISEGCDVFPKGPEAVARGTRELLTRGYKRVDSRVQELGDKRPDLSFLAGERPMDESYVLINPEAGQRGAFWRAISPEVLDLLVHHAQTKVVLVGNVPANTRSDIPGAVDICGRTNVEQLINWVYHSSGFFAYDGAIAYMAMAMGKRGTLLFTHQEKQNGAAEGYMCDEWRSQVRLGFAGEKLASLEDVSWAISS